MVGTSGSSQLYHKIRIERETEESRERFIQEGEDYTRGYLEGRKGRVIANLFSTEYKGARRAIDEMADGSYGENEMLNSGRYLQA